MKSANLNCFKRNLSRVVLLCSIFCLSLFVQSANAQEEGPRRFNRDGTPAKSEEKKTETRTAVPESRVVGAAPGSAGGSASMQAKVKNAIQDILDEQDRFGQNPSNNTLLADLQDVLIRHSTAKILVINHGPGQLILELPGGANKTLGPGWGDYVEVESGRISLVADRDFVDITLEHIANSECRFWDGDDNNHTKLGSSATKHGAQLGRGLRHYWLEK